MLPAGADYSCVSNTDANGTAEALHRQLVDVRSERHHNKAPTIPRLLTALSQKPLARTTRRCGLRTPDAVFGLSWSDDDRTAACRPASSPSSQKRLSENKDRLQGLVKPSGERERAARKRTFVVSLVMAWSPALQRRAIRG
jgi:hypothetical protein